MCIEACPCGGPGPHRLPDSYYIYISIHTLQCKDLYVNVPSYYHAHRVVVAVAKAVVVAVAIIVAVAVAFHFGSPSHLVHLRDPDRPHF